MPQFLALIEINAEVALAYLNSPFLQATVFFLFLEETTCTILMFVATHYQTLVAKPGTIQSFVIGEFVRVILVHSYPKEKT